MWKIPLSKYECFLSIICNLEEKRSHAPEITAGSVTMQMQHNAMSDSSAGSVPMGFLQEIP